MTIISVGTDAGGNLCASVDDGSVVASTKSATNFGVCHIGVLVRQIHGQLSALHETLLPAL